MCYVTHRFPAIHFRLVDMFNKLLQVLEETLQFEQNGINLGDLKILKLRIK